MSPRALPRAVTRRALVRGGLAAAALVAASACRPRRRKAGEPYSLRLAVVPKGTTHEFWKSIHAGALAAAEALNATLARDRPGGVVGVELIWKGPLREDDREQQIQVIEGFTAQGVDGIVLAPLDARALARPVEEARRLGIPTVVIDSPLDCEVLVSTVATDNYQGGALAADRLAEVLGGRGRVILLRYQQGSASTEAREAGFLDRLRQQHPGLTVLSADQHGGPTRDTAKRAAENLLNRFGDEVDGLFAPNEPNAVGALLALQDVGKAGRVRYVGFDTAPVLVEALRRGQMDGFVVQDPFRIGRRGVEVMVAHLVGQPVAPREATPAVLVTPENLDSPEVQRLVRPPA